MNLKELFWSGGGMVLVLLSLIEVSPIKINPWSRLAKIIGHALNAEVLEQRSRPRKSWRSISKLMMSAMLIFCVLRSCVSMMS